MFLVVSLKGTTNDENAAYCILIGPPTAEALLYGIFLIQKKIRNRKVTRMWYRR